MKSQNNGSAAPTRSGIMDQRPQIYFKLEFGVSWTPGRPAVPRQMTYMSRDLREREQQFPRQLPPTNTNYLAAYSEASQANRSRQQLQHATLQQYPYQHYFPSENMPEQRHKAAPPEPQLAPTESQGGRRGSRSQSRPSSHERGRSAPPPLNDSPWDAEPEPMAASALPAKREPVPTRHVIERKKLPASASQVSLASNLTSGPLWAYATDYLEQAEDNAPNPSARQHPVRYGSIRPADDDGDRKRVREIESLAPALMTVDNGFEDQWWNQGERETMMQASLSPLVSGRRASVTGSPWREHDIPPDRLDFEPSGVSPDLTNSPPTRSDLVSPLSEYGSSMYSMPPRSLTTRSDELHM
jgi:hypothetical protein